MENDRKFLGIWIPAEVWLDHSISIIERALFAEIHSLDGPRGCFASNEYFAENFGVTVATISKGIARLKETGYIEQVSFDGRRRILRSLLSFERQTSKKLKADVNEFEDSIQDFSRQSSNPLKHIEKKITKTENKEYSEDAPAHFADAVKVSKGQPVIDFVPESLLEVEITEAAPKNCPTGDVVQPRTKMTGKQLQDLLQSDGSIQEANMDSISQTVTIVRTGPNNVKCVELIEITGPEPTKRKPSAKTGKTLIADVYTREGFITAWSWTTFAKENPHVDAGTVYDKLEAWSSSNGEKKLDWLATGRVWVQRGKPEEFIRKATETVAAQVKMAQAAGYQPTLKEIAAAQYLEYQERNAAKGGPRP